MLHQTFEPHTWFADVVQFGHYDALPITYILFVHANSRYAILEAANLEPTKDEDIYEYNPNQRKNTNIWMRCLKNLCEHHQVKNLITDYEPAFRSRKANRFYQQHDITHYPINVSQDGHIRLSILDRLVRTLRDMLYNAKLNETNPEHLQTIINVYNTTKHGTLTKHIGVPTTPKDVFEDEELEQQFIRQLQSDNWSISHQQGYIIPDGEKVVVKKVYNNVMEKKRGTAEDGDWIVETREGQKYHVRNLTNNEVRIVPRSQIKRIPRQRLKFKSVV